MRQGTVKVLLVAALAAGVYGYSAVYAEEPATRTSSSSGFFTRLFSSASSASPASPTAPAIPRPPQPDLYDKLLFHPTKFPKGWWDTETPAREDLWFQASDGTKLNGWYCPCEKPRAFVLYAHGNGGTSHMTASCGCQTSWAHPRKHVPVAQGYRWIPFSDAGLGRSRKQAQLHRGFGQLRRPALAKPW